MERQSLYWDMAQIQYKDAVLWVKECSSVQIQWSSKFNNWSLCTEKMTSLQGSTYQEIFTCLTSKILHYSIQIIYDLEENFGLPNYICPTGNFTCPRPSGIGISPDLYWNV